MNAGDAVVWKVMEDSNFLHGLMEPCFVTAFFVYSYGLPIDQFPGQVEKKIMQYYAHASKVGARQLRGIVRQQKMVYQTVDEFLAELKLVGDTLSAADITVASPAAESMLRVRPFGGIRPVWANDLANIVWTPDPDGLAAQGPPAQPVDEDGENEF